MRFWTLSFGILTVGLTMGLAVPQARAAQSFIIVDNQTGEILAGKDASSKRQVASLTKIATASVVLDAEDNKLINLNDEVAVPPQAGTTGGVNPAGLQAGDVLSIRDLIYCALLASDNTAAYTLAYHIGQKMPNRTGLDPAGNFVSYMNALGRTLGMKHTLFLNPHGIDSVEGEVPFSTAADMARLTRYALEGSDFRFYVSQASRDIHINRGGQSLEVRLQNTNPLLGQDGIDGVKTGRTTKAGDCIVLSSYRSPEVVKDGNKVSQTPRRIIVVILGSTDRASEGISLIRQGWSLYEEWATKGRKSGKTL